MLPAVISFADYSGVAVEPWAEAGFPCYLVDLQHPRVKPERDRRGITRIGANILELHPYHRWLPQGPIALAFAWPECTHFTYSGARWRRENGPAATAEGFRLFAACWDLLRFYERERGAAWMLENPKGLPWSWSQPDHKFHPWHYGDHESKETGVWCGGGFIMPPPSVTQEPQDVCESVWKMAPGPERANQRSLTSVAFARAVFVANTSRQEWAQRRTQGGE